MTKAGRRGPRPEEIALLSLLVEGPREILQGPLGRCMKRGWCERVARDGDARTLIGLTEAGRQWLNADAPSDSGPSESPRKGLDVR